MPTSGQDSKSGSGVDAYGGPVVDPTKNVLDLVRAESRYQDGMREAAEKYNKGIRQAEIRRLEELANAETRRVDDLNNQRVRYEERIAEDLKVNVKTTSDQLAGQLIKETNALSGQIQTLNTSFTNQFATLNSSLTSQVASITTGINARVAELEKFRWETGGKSAVADPALTLALSQIAASQREQAVAIAGLKDVATRGVGREEEKHQVVDNSQKGSALSVAIVASIIGGLGVITGLVMAVFAIFHH